MTKVVGPGRPQGGGVVAERGSQSCWSTVTGMPSRFSALRSASSCSTSGPAEAR